MTHNCTNCILILFLDSDNEISKQKFSKVTEKLKQTVTSMQTDIKSDSAADDDIEILEKPDSSDIEKKLE